MLTLVVSVINIKCCRLSLREGAPVVKLDISFEDGDGYLLVRTKGEWIPFTLLEAIQNVAEVARERGCTRVLWNANGTGVPEFDLYRFFAGKDVAKFLNRPIRLAIVYPAEHINRIGERAAVKRGANVIVMSSFDNAVAWLMDDV
jgi:hypothetical protein